MPREIDLECPECAKVTRWVEREVPYDDDDDAVFKGVPATSAPRMVCSECGVHIGFDDLKPPAGLSPLPTKRSTEWDKGALLAALKAKMRPGGK